MPAGHEVDALCDAGLDFGKLGAVGQGRRLGVADFVHRRRLGAALPADLLDAVKELVDMAVGVERIDIPVRAGRVAPGTVDAQAELPEILETLNHLAQAADLPGDLVGRDLGEFALELVVGRQRAAREEHERMVFGAMPGEIADQRPHLGAFLGCEARRQVELVGDAQAEQLFVKAARDFRVGDIDAEMPEAPHLERSRQADAANNVFGG